MNKYTTNKSKAKAKKKIEEETPGCHQCSKLMSFCEGSVRSDCDLFSKKKEPNGLKGVPLHTHRGSFMR